MKLCKDCKFYGNSKYTDTKICMKHPDKRVVDPVSGEKGIEPNPRTLTCAQARMSLGFMNKILNHCGKDGRLWEERED